MTAAQKNQGSPHQTVLPEEAVDALLQNVRGVYVDATFGRGGHAAILLKRLAEEGRVIAVDRDPEAISYGKKRFADEPRIELVHAEFSALKSVVMQRDLVGNLSGVLLDLGVSSPQLDESGRGFSFMREGPLDMRMNTSSGVTAAQWINSAAESDIAEVLQVLGEERFARRIARALVKARAERTIETTRQLADLIVEAVPSFDQGKHPATRSFQAVRMYINSELPELEALLNDVIELLAPGGRLVVISFHSLEDRIVKRFMRDASRPPAMPKEIPLIESGTLPPLRLVGRAVRAGEREVESNPRARSAIMRVAEKVA